MEGDALAKNSRGGVRRVLSILSRLRKRCILHRHSLLSETEGREVAFLLVFLPPSGPGQATIDRPGEAARLGWAVGPSVDDNNGNPISRSLDSHPPSPPGPSDEISDPGGAVPVMSCWHSSVRVLVHRLVTRLVPFGRCDKQSQSQVAADLVLAQSISHSSNPKKTRHTHTHPLFIIRATTSKSSSSLVRRGRARRARHERRHARSDASTNEDDASRPRRPCTSRDVKKIKIKIKMKERMSALSSLPRHLEGPRGRCTSTSTCTSTGSTRREYEYSSQRKSFAQK